MHWIALRPESGAVQEGTLTDPVSALGWWALRYTPKVVCLEGVVLLEVSASARLWGGLSALVQHIIETNRPVALAEYAQGATSLIAIAQLLVAPSCPGVHRPGGAVDELPLRTLTAAALHLNTLARLGASTWGQLRALPRGGVARRFGAALLDALDQAYGLRPDLYPWLVLPPTFDVSLELMSHVESASALQFAARRLLAQLRVWLQLRHLGVLALEWLWQMDERRHTATLGALLLRSAQPTQDMAHLQRLLAEHLAHVRLPAPAHTLRLRSVETSVLVQGCASVLPDANRMGDSLAQMVERLSARFGADKVLQLQVRLDHRPEHMQRWCAAAAYLVATHAYWTGAGCQKRIKSKTLGADDISPRWPQALYPTWLLEVPLPLAGYQQLPHDQGPLTWLAGPHRLESGWWGGGDMALRDYFVARSAQSGLLWVYRERLEKPSATEGQAHAKEAHSCWYLHGLFA